MVGVYTTLSLEDAPFGGFCSWCPATSLLAAQLQHSLLDRIGISIVDSDDTQGYVGAAVPARVAGEDAERLIALEWSPVRTRRLLAAATSSGSIYSWSQPSHAPRLERPLTLDQWHCQKVFQTASQPVAVKWLRAPLAWHWQPVAADGTSLSSFPPCAASCSSWLRAGLPCLAAVLSDGAVQLCWKSHGATWQHCLACPGQPGASTALADLVVDSTGQLWLCKAETASNVIALQQLKGYATAHADSGLSAFNSVTSGQLAAEGAKLHTLAFTAQGAGLLTIVESMGDWFLHLYDIQENQGSITASLCSTQQLADKGAWQGSAAPEKMLEQSTDGILIAVCSCRSGVHAVLLLESKALEVKLMIQVGEPIRSIALSGNSEAVAVSLARGALQLMSTTEAPQDTAAKTLARRWAWSFVNGTSCWDIISALRALEPAGLKQALWLLDEACHNHPQATRLSFNRALLQLKLRILPGLDDPSARAVAQDVWAKCLISASDPVVTAVHKAFDEQRILNKANPTSAPQQLTFTSKDERAISGWAAWADRYTTFHIQSVRLWVMRRRAATTAGTADALIDAMPCIRLLADGGFANQLRHVLTLQILLKRSSPEAGFQEAGLAKLFIAAIEAVQAALTAANRDANAAASAGQVGPAEARLTGLAAASFEGNYRLHYAAAYGTVNWQVIEAALRSPALQAIVQALPEPSESNLVKLATDLGIRHRFRSSGAGPVRRDANPADLTPVYPDAGTAALFGQYSSEELNYKRKRWQAALDTAFDADSGLAR